MLRSTRNAETAFLWAFDLIEHNGEDIRSLPLEKRKSKLERLLARGRDGISFKEHVHHDGVAVFEAARKMGLEGIVSKRLAAPYRSGRSTDWVKTKNPASPERGGLSRKIGPPDDDAGDRLCLELQRSPLYAINAI